MAEPSNEDVAVDILVLCRLLQRMGVGLPLTMYLGETVTGDGDAPIRAEMTVEARCFWHPCPQCGTRTLPVAESATDPPEYACSNDACPWRGERPPGIEKWCENMDFEPRSER